MRWNHKMRYWVADRWWVRDSSIPPVLERWYSVHLSEQIIVTLLNFWEWEWKQTHKNMTKMSAREKIHPACVWFLLFVCFWRASFDIWPWMEVGCFRFQLNKYSLNQHAVRCQSTHKKQLWSYYFRGGKIPPINCVIELIFLSLCSLSQQLFTSISFVQEEEKKLHRPVLSQKRKNTVSSLFDRRMDESNLWWMKTYVVAYGCWQRLPSRAPQRWCVLMYFRCRLSVLLSCAGSWAGILQCITASSHSGLLEYKYHNTLTHPHTPTDTQGGHTKAYSINHGVLWPYLLNANIMDPSDKPLLFSL